MTRSRALLGLLLPLCLAPAGAAPAVLLDEDFGANRGNWLVDDFSRLEQGGYVIDATGTGGYYRWLEQPADLADYLAEVTVQKLRGNNDQPLYGLLFRVQKSWRDSYFYVINGTGEFFCGKFAAGSASILRQGSHASIRTAGAENRLAVRAAGGRLTLLANGATVAEVEDSSFTVGRVGLCVEAPAAVKFDDLLVTALADPGSDPVASGGQASLFSDDFTSNQGWSTDAFRSVAGGVYHLQNAGEHKSYVSWHPATSKLTDHILQAEVRRLAGDAKGLSGLVWRVQDGSGFYFFLIAPDGRYYAGLSGTGIEVKAKGRAMAIRGGQEANTLRVTALGSAFTCAVNGVNVAEFRDSTYPAGAVGFYLEQPGHVTFDNLNVTRPGHAAPSVGPQPGKLLLEDPLVTATSGWPEDEHHVFDLGGYCVRAPDEGSRTVIHRGSLRQGDGVYRVMARPVQGNLTGSYGLVVRATQEVDNFYFLLLNATGGYIVGRCQNNVFARLGSGTVAQLRGDGNTFSITIREGQLTYGINDQTLGTLDVPAKALGAVGVHVENGVVACFRDLTIHAPGETP